MGRDICMYRHNSYVASQCRQKIYIIWLPWNTPYHANLLGVLHVVAMLAVVAWWYAAQLWHVLFLFLQSSTIWKQMAGEKISEFLMVIKYTARKGSSHSGTMSSYIHYTNSTPLATSLMQCLCWRWITFYCCAGPKHCDWFALDWHISYMGNRMPRKKMFLTFSRYLGCFPCFSAWNNNMNMKHHVPNPYPSMSFDPKPRVWWERGQQASVFQNSW